MRRREFLGLMAALAGAGAGALGMPAAPMAAQVDRLRWWAPYPLVGPDGEVMGLEWRYLAGLISDAGKPTGFVVSLVTYSNIPFVQAGRYELLVMREDLTGAEPHRTRTYQGALTYDAATASYSFSGPDSSSASWRLDSAAGSYSLSVSTAELTLQGLTLLPAGPMIAESGDGVITDATFSGVEVFSDYYADWVAFQRAGETIGYGRFDIQNLKTRGLARPTGFSHHWFGIAAEAAGQPVWVSAWRLVSEKTYWVVTVARGSGATWTVESFTEASPGFAHPLAVEILEWQPQPVPAGEAARRTGRRWRVTAGRLLPGDLLDLDISVPPGQFIGDLRVAAGVTSTSRMQEAITGTAAGSVAGAAFGNLRFAVAESTYSELDPGQQPTPSPTTPTPSPTTPTPTPTGQRLNLPFVQR